MHICIWKNSITNDPDHVCWQKTTTTTSAQVGVTKNSVSAL